MSAPESTLQVRVVPSNEFELEALAELINEAFAVHTFLGGPRTSPEEVAEEAGDSGEMVLIEDGGELVACALIRPADDMEGAGVDASECFVESFAGALYFGLASVRAARKGQGLGKRLLAESEALARERGCPSVMLGTIDGMKLVGYYESQGYELVAEREFEAGHWGIPVNHTVHNMVKAL